MKKSFKLLVAFFLLNLVALASFAEGYHVCVASYQKLSNAQEMVQRLEKQSISAIISESKVKNQSYYRVLLAKEFRKIEDARKYRDEVQKYSFVRELGLRDFWVCKSEKIVSKQPAAPRATVKSAPVVKPRPPAPAPAPRPAERPRVAEPKPEPVPEPPVRNVEPEPEPAPVPPPAPVEEAPAEAPAPEPEPPSEVEVIVVPPAEDAQFLDKNEEDVLSEETPYSVHVRSYKYSQFAENDSNRLKELGFDSYLLNTFDDENFFAFNIHVGAFKTQEEAEVLQNQFTDAGIADTQISNYNDIKPKLDKYDEILSTERVAFNDGRSDIPTSIPSSIEKLVTHFPANKDFQITEITMLDYENYKAAEDRPDLSPQVLEGAGYGQNVHALLLATYRDELYRKEVSVFLASAEDIMFEESYLNSKEKLQLGTEKGTFDADIYEKGRQLILCGKNESEKIYVRMRTSDLSQEEFISFLNDSFNDSSLALYPQLRRTFFVLPDANSATGRDFISFSFRKVGSDYASERGNVAWAQAIVGHSHAKTFYRSKNSLVCIGFYDLDYDFNARTVHTHFTDAKKSVEVSETNQPVSVNGISGWYLVNSTQKEVSLSTKSYVIAIDTDPNSQLQKNDLAQLGTELKIWGAGNAD